MHCNDIPHVCLGVSLVKNNDGGKGQLVLITCCLRATSNCHRKLPPNHLWGVHAQAVVHVPRAVAEAGIAETARAKADGASVTAGVSINHLSLNENDIGEYRTFFRLAPPLRAEEDRLAMVEALRDGTIDIIVSSHDPQDVDTKRLPFADAADGD